MNIAPKYLSGLGPVSGQLSAEGQSLAPAHPLFLDSLGCVMTSVCLKSYSQMWPSQPRIAILRDAVHHIAQCPLQGKSSIAFVLRTLLSIASSLSHGRRALWTMLGSPLANGTRELTESQTRLPCGREGVATIGTFIFIPGSLLHPLFPFTHLFHSWGSWGSPSSLLLLMILSPSPQVM